MGAMQARKWLEGVVDGDPAKAVLKMYELANLENPPLHFPLGKDSLGVLKKKIESLTMAFRDYESWSDDLLAED